MKLTSAVLLALVVCAQAACQSLSQLNTALQAGEADKTLSLLHSLPQNAEWHNLDCRVQLNLEHWDAAASECQKAVDQDEQNSNYHMWLGRALGEKASRASFLSAYSLAKRVRNEFETAVRLDPANAAALADLGEFYYSAPGIVGGGDDKANRIADQLDHVDPARAHELRARIAEQNKDYDAAEREFKEAIAVSKQPAFQWMTLAAFYRRRERWSDMEAAVEKGFRAEQHDPRAGVALYNGASTLIRAGKNFELAAQLLEKYLAGDALTEEAPAFVAHTRLAKLKAALGDKSGAREERAAALALAHDYKPALELKF
jgi:tetratricopeptide (TPR) repeat protein